MTNATRSQIFSSYNVLRGAHALDEGRLNRGLGIAQRSRPAAEYVTTADACSCPDAKYRPGTVCKHRIALLLRGDFGLQAPADDDSDPFEGLV